MSEPLPAVPNVIKAVAEGVTSFAKNWLNLFYFLYSGSPPTLPTLIDFASQIYDAFSGNFSPLQPPSTTLEQVSVTDLSTDMMPTGISATSTPGTSTADKLPANCATLVNMDVGMRYRGGHPRNYLYCGTDENLLNESEWNAAYLTTATNAFRNFIAAVNGLSSGGTVVGSHVMVSYFGGVPTIDGKSQRRVVPLVLPISGFTVNPIVGSQRRRLGRRG